MPVEIRMPQISMTMIDGTIVKWLKNEGDTVAEGETLVEIQTDKIVDMLASSTTGVLQTIVAQEGEIVPVGEMICVITVAGEVTQSPVLAPPDMPTPVETPASAKAGEKSPEKRVLRASPLAKKIAAQKGLDLLPIQGTGPGGMIVKADLPEVTLRAPERAAAPQIVIGGDTVLPIEGIRKTIADNLMLSKRSSAEVTTVADVDMGAVKAMRAVLPLSYTVFCVLASAKALLEYPLMNALVEEERIVMKRQINICVAVATKLGLLTPVIHDAGRKNLLTIAEDLNDLAERGREGRLAARDFEGGTFTVTNSGVYGSVLFTPIINHPQSAVLGLGRIAMTPVVRDEAIVPALMMYMSLTYNHRSIDGDTAVRFLQRIRFYLEHPDKMLELKKASA